MSSELETAAGAISELRKARDPAGRVAAVSRAVNALQGLREADRESLVEALLAHGAPEAGRLLTQRPDGVLSAEDVTLVAQDLLGLGPDQAARLADRLEAAMTVGPTLAGAASGRHTSEGDPTPSGAAAPPSGPDTASGPPPVPAAARWGAAGASRPAGSGPTAGSVSPAVSARRASPGSVGPAARQAGEGRENRVGAASDPVGEALVEQLVREPRPRARRHAVAATSGVRPLAVDTLLEVLAGIPEGWQRRVALRRVLGTVPVVLDARAHELLDLFPGPVDRFTAAALLVRCGLAPAEGLTGRLEPGHASRLDARAARAARSATDNDVLKEEFSCGST